MLAMAEEETAKPVSPPEVAAGTPEAPELSLEQLGAAEVEGIENAANSETERLKRTAARRGHGPGDRGFHKPGRALRASKRKKGSRRCAPWSTVT
jgi:hypothetical protein